MRRLMIYILVIALLKSLTFSVISFGAMEKVPKDSFPEVEKRSKEFLSIFNSNPLEKTMGKLKETMLNGFFSGSKKLLRKKDFPHPQGKEDLRLVFAQKNRTAYPSREIIDEKAIYTYEQFLTKAEYFQRMYPEFFSFSEIGQSDEEYGILVFRIGKSKEKDKCIMFVGGSGKEEGFRPVAASLKTVDLLLYQLRHPEKENDFCFGTFLEDMDILVLPCANPSEIFAHEKHPILPLGQEEPHISKEVYEFLQQKKPICTVSYCEGEKTIAFADTATSTMFEGRDKRIAESFSREMGYRKSPMYMGVLSQGTDLSGWVRNELHKMAFSIGVSYLDKENKEKENHSLEDASKIFPVLMKYLSLEMQKTVEVPKFHFRTFSLEGEHP